MKVEVKVKAEVRVKVMKERVVDGREVGEVVTHHRLLVS